jgi:hypothetical protein
MVRCPAGPDTPVLDNMRLLDTFNALCAVADTDAITKPITSNVGALQDAAAMPKAIGINDANVVTLGSACTPSNRKVNKTVIIGIPHLDVYVKPIPIRSNAILNNNFQVYRNKTKNYVLAVL